ncbi:MAG: hypothetical protein WB507_02705 [Solirubrobacterales bacterium]
MGRRLKSRTGKWRAKCAALALVAVSLILAASASAELVGGGNLAVSFSGAITPTKLPRSAYVPLSVFLDASFKTTDGSRLPELRTVSVRFDRHGRIETKGLPTCTAGQLKDTLIARARQVCGAAQVGAGNVTAEIAFPEQAPFSATGPLLVFNAASLHGKPALLLYVNAAVPIPTTYVTEATIAQRRSGPILTVKMPKIDAGYGRLATFDVTLRPKTNGHSLLSASCPAPGGLAGASFTLARASYGFSGGPTVKASLSSHCEVGG